MSAASAPKQSAHERKMSETIATKLKRQPTAEEEDDEEDDDDESADSKQKAAKDPAKEAEALAQEQRSLRISVHVKDQKPDDEDDDFKE